MPKLAERIDAQRKEQADKILEMVEPVPEEWIEQVDVEADSLSPLPCTRFSDLVEAWRKAIRWRFDLDVVLSTMLAVSTSTLQKGDQIFLMVVGAAGGGKSQLCDGMTISRYCYQLEHLTGWFSGYKDHEGGKDYSLITRVNTNCMVTSEGDVLMSNLNFQEVMSKGRRIFDGKASATYKNMDEDRFYNWIRLTWIVAGTFEMLEKDNASLGDRFLKIFMESPTERERRRILRTSGRNAWNAVKQTSQPGKEINNDELVRAQRMTGGYADWLRENVHLLDSVQCDDKYFEECEHLALLVAIFRARPARDEDREATKEEPNRLNAQFTRIMCTQTMVLNKTEVDEEVMKRIRRLAFGTGYGIVQDIIRLLYTSDHFVSSKAIALYLDRSDEHVRKYMRFLRRIKAVHMEADAVNAKTKPRGARTGGKRAQCWGLTPYVEKLCDEVL